jgi:serine/threonine-protein kinase
VWVVGLVLFMGVGLYFVTRLSDTLDSKAPGGTMSEIKKDVNPLNLKNFEEPQGAVNPQLPPTTPQDVQHPQQQGSAQEVGKPKDKGVAQQQLRANAGWLTLITMPEAEVFKGKATLGKTPLFRAPLPVGVHMLRLKGADGVQRALSVKIEGGKTTAMKFALSDLPSAP